MKRPEGVANLHEVKFRGSTAIVFAGHGIGVTNRDLVQKFAGEWLSHEVAGNMKFLADSGITLRHQPNPLVLYKDYPERTNREVIDMSTFLAKKAMALNGWDTADLLIGVTSSPPDDRSDWVKEVARGASIPDSVVWERNMTCDGGIAALVDVFNTPALKKSRVVIADYEPLGSHLNHEEFVPSVVFGSGGAALAFIPSEFESIDPRTVIVPDPKGVIRIPRMYELAPAEKRSQLPDWVEVQKGGEEVYAYTETSSGNIARLALMESDRDPNFIDMDGVLTAQFFGKKVPEFLFESLDMQRLRHGPGRPIDFIVGHQPSGTVAGRVRKLLERGLEGHNRDLPKDRHLPPFKENFMRWVLDEAEMPNVSSATTFIAMAMEKARIEQGGDFLVTAYGAGAAFSSVGLRHTPKE